MTKDDPVHNYTMKLNNSSTQKRRKKKEVVPNIKVYHKVTLSLGPSLMFLILVSSSIGV
jgi:hypothetical protein